MWFSTNLLTEPSIRGSRPGGEESKLLKKVNMPTSENNCTATPTQQIKLYLISLIQELIYSFFSQKNTHQINLK